MCGVPSVMPCILCASDKEAESPAEMIIHFSGLENVDKPGVWVFPKVLVCLNCGSSRFGVTKEKLVLLAKGTGRSAAAES